MRSIVFRVLGWCPGAVGLVLRQMIYPRLLGRCGRKVLFGRYVILHNPAQIHIGNNCIVSDYVTLDARSGKGGTAPIMIADNVFIGTGTLLRNRGWKIAIGRGSNLGSFCRIHAQCPVFLREEVLLAAYCILGRSLPAGTREAGANIDQADGQPRETVVGRGCWLGVRSYVGPGCRIGEGAVVGAHAVVHGPLPPYVVAVGRPARTLYDRRQKPTPGGCP
jgi:acetyltransferase-like isoleucine patch superfamily enzyme